MLNLLNNFPGLPWASSAFWNSSPLTCINKKKKKKKGYHNSTAFEDVPKAIVLFPVFILVHIDSYATIISWYLARNCHEFR